MRAPLGAPTPGASQPHPPLPYTADAPAIPVSLTDNRQAERN